MVCFDFSMSVLLCLCYHICIIISVLSYLCYHICVIICRLPYTCNHICIIIRWRAELLYLLMYTFSFICIKQKRGHTWKETYISLKTNQYINYVLSYLYYHKVARWGTLPSTHIIGGMHAGASTLRAPSPRKHTPKRGEFVFTNGTRGRYSHVAGPAARSRFFFLFNMIGFFCRI